MSNYREEVIPQCDSSNTNCVDLYLKLQLSFTLPGSDSGRSVAKGFLLVLYVVLSITIRFWKVTTGGASKLNDVARDVA